MKEMLDNNDPGVIRVSPYGNNLLADFTKKAIEKEMLGKDEITDFLAVSFSSTDYVGHTFGPRSIETVSYTHLDVYKRQVQHMIISRKRLLKLVKVKHN